MKKILLSFVMAVAALAAHATTEDIISKFTYTWNGAETFTNNEDGSITFNAVSWGGLAAWLPEGDVKCDWSAWKKVVFEFAEPTTVNTQILVGDASAWGEVGITKLECSFEGKDMSALDQIALQASAPTTLIITRIYLSDGEDEGGEGEDFKIAVLDATGGTHVLPAGDWGWDGVWLDRDVTAYNTLIFEVESVTGHGNIVVKGIDKNGDPVQDEIDFDKPFYYIIEIDDWAKIEQYAYQNVYRSSDEVEKPDGETTIVIKKVWLTSQTADEYVESLMHVFAIGNLAGCNGWDPSDGSLELTYNKDTDTFTGTITVLDEWEGNGWFAFGIALGADKDDWATFNQFRISVAPDWGTLDVATPVEIGLNQSFKLPAGIYNVTFDNYAGTILFTAATENSISDVTTEAAPVAYYSIAGARLNAPQKGVNVVRMSNGAVKKVLVK